jgi:hypothetical protein
MAIPLDLILVPPSQAMRGTGAALRQRYPSADYSMGATALHLILLAGQGGRSPVWQGGRSRLG